MKKLFQIGSDFWKQVFTLLSGSLAAQLISVIFLPILARLYVPDDFGVLGVFIAAVAVLVVLINGGYELAIMLPDKEEEADSLMRLSIRVSHFLSLFLFLLLLLFGPFLLRVSELQVLDGWYFLLPVSIWLEGIIQVLGIRLNRMRAYKALSIAKLIRSALTALMSFGLAFQLGGFEGLLIGYLLGQAGMAIYSYGYFLLKGEKNREKVQEGKLLRIAKKYADFPRYSVLGASLNTASKHLPFFLLPKLYSTAIGGQFSKADRILNLPAVLVSMSIGKVYFEQASRAELEGGDALAKLTRDTFLRLLSLAIPFFLVIMIWAPDLFSFVLGEPWRLAGTYARCLMPWMFMVFIFSPLSYLIDIRRKLKVFLYFNVLMFLTRLASLLIGAKYLDDIGTMWLFGISGAMMVLIQLLYILNLAGVFKRK